MAEIEKTLFVGPFAPPFTGDGVKNNFLKEGFEAAGVHDITWFDTICRSGNNKWMHLIRMFPLIASHSQIIMSLNRKGRYAIITLFFLFKIFSNRKRAVLYVVGGTFDRQLDKMPSVFKNIYVYMINRLDGVFAESYILKNGLKSMGIKNVEIVYNPRKDSGDKWVLTEQNRGRIIFISRVCETKGTPYLIDAVEGLAHKGINVTLDLYGPIDEYYEEEFYERIEKLKGVIDYKGLVNPNEVQGAMKQYHFLSLPTFHHGEGLPGVLVEAGMAGIPILITRFNAFPEYFTHQKSAFFVEPHDLEELKSAIEEMLHNDDLLMGLSKGVAKVAEPFSLNNVMERSFDLLNKKGWVFNYQK